MKSMAGCEEHRRFMVEVAYARADEQLIVEVELKAGATAMLAIEASGLLDRYPEIDLAIHGVGVFGKPVGFRWPLRGNDRVEIYRPLIADPKEARRRRAAAARGTNAPRSGR
jgi:putative ubiquitin-RnfH superfamily antitoxin RatB of RatAB toxin-antitoxin module